MKYTPKMTDLSNEKSQSRPGPHIPIVFILFTKNTKNTLEAQKVKLFLFATQCDWNWILFFIPGVISVRWDGDIPSESNAQSLGDHIFVLPKQGCQPQSAVALLVLFKNMDSWILIEETQVKQCHACSSSLLVVNFLLQAQISCNIIWLNGTVKPLIT